MQQNQQAAETGMGEAAKLAVPLVVETMMTIKGMELPIGRILEKALGEVLTKSTRYDQLAAMIDQIKNLKTTLAANLAMYQDSVVGAEMDDEQRAIFDNNVTIAKVKLGLLDVYLDQTTKFRTEHETALASVVSVPHVELINGLTEAVDHELARQAQEAEAQRQAKEAATNAAANDSAQGDATSAVKTEEGAEGGESTQNLSEADAQGNRVSNEGGVPANDTATADLPKAEAPNGLELSSKNVAPPAAPEVLTLGGHAKSE